MFRILVRGSLLKAPNSAGLTSRQISTTSILYKAKSKKKSKSSNSSKEEEAILEEDDPFTVIPSLTDSCKRAVEEFKKKASVTKQGFSNPAIFDKISVPINSHESYVFTSVAQTAVKGRNLIITVFDPKNVKHVISAVLAAKLNVTPETVPNNPQQLKVPLATQTTESKNEIVKELKQELEFFKSGGGRFTLKTARNNALKKLKEYKKSDIIKKVDAEVEKIHKKYADELQEQYKILEKSVMK